MKVEQLGKQIDATCPDCRARLFEIQAEPGVAVFCGNGRCLSVAANDGAWGETQSAAVKNLEAAIDKECDREFEQQRVE